MCLPAFLREALVNYASNMIEQDWTIAQFFDNNENFCMVPIICKSLFAKAVGAIHRFIFSFFFQIKTLDEIERRSCYANGFSNCSNTSSKISFHGLPSKTKRPGIRKQIVVIITVDSLLVYWLFLQPSAERYFSKHFFRQYFHELLENSFSASKKRSEIF